jgi:haloalkane dehalogenase
MSRAPAGYGFTPAEHSDAVAALIGHLELKNFTLVVQDWGGPIGMAYAARNRDHLRGLVVMNTWAWPASLLQNLFSLAMGGWPLGYWLQTQKNFFAKSMLPDGLCHKEKATESFKKAYTDPFPTPESRKPTWIFPRQIRESRPWLAEIESQLPNLADLPAQILWGKYDDPGFPRAEMEKWRGYLKLNETETLDDAGHSVQEDRPDRVAASIRRVLQRTSP